MSMRPRCHSTSSVLLAVFTVLRRENIATYRKPNFSSFQSFGIGRAMSMDAEKPVKVESKFIKQEEIAKARWISLQKITYSDPTGKERTWEAVFRTTKQGDGPDAVVIIPIVKKKNKGDSFVLVKQYRPPIKCYTLEFPAGLVDAGETAEKSALRELHEETGYTGTVLNTSPVTCLDPGVGNCTVKFVTVEVNGDAPENCMATAQPEFTETFIIPVAKFADEVNRFSSEGVMVDARVLSYALALEQSKLLKLN